MALSAKEKEWQFKSLKKQALNIGELRKTVESYVPATTRKIHLANIPLVKQAEKALKITYLEAKYFKSIVIGTEHLLLAIFEKMKIVLQPKP